VIVGRLIPAGTGLAYHEQRRRERLGPLDLEGALPRDEQIPGGDAQEPAEESTNENSA
jgi:hypothetical protein